MKYQFKLLLAVAVIVVGLASIFYIFSNTSYSQNQPGPHSGKMLTDGNISVEITMYERGMPPHFRVYLYQNKKPLNPNLARLVMTLKRFDGTVYQVQFEAIEGYLQSREDIPEPHSFDVTVNLKLNDKDIKWNYENVEGRITLSPEVIKSAGIKTDIAGAATIEKKLSVIGKIAVNGDALSSIYPRFGGIIKEMKKYLGDTVEKGEVIAIVESNESLRDYPITSPISGTIVQKYVIVGEMIKEDKPIYQVANLSSVWADLTLYRKEAALIKKGMPTTVVGDNGVPKSSGIINYISPLGIEDSQTILARSVLANDNQEWVPGMFINGSIIYLSKDAPVTIKLSALQRWNEWDVIFIQKGNSFEATPVELGEKNGKNAEVIKGIKAGQSYVSENSYLLKAELGKSSASHDH